MNEQQPQQLQQQATTNNNKELIANNQQPVATITRTTTVEVKKNIVLFQMLNLRITDPTALRSWRVALEGLIGKLPPGEGLKVLVLGKAIVTINNDEFNKHDHI